MQSFGLRLKYTILMYDVIVLLLSLLHNIILINICLLTLYKRKMK